MIEIEMSKDIREFSPKILGPFDKRQLVVVLLSIFIGLPIFLLLGSLPLQFKLIFSIIFTLPVLLCGWVKVFGMPLEVFLFNFVLPNILSPKRRVYMTDNEYENLFVGKGKNPYKTEQILRNIPVVKLKRKERLALEAKLKKYGASK